MKLPGLHDFQAVLPERWTSSLPDTNVTTAATLLVPDFDRASSNKGLMADIKIPTATIITPHLINVLDKGIASASPRNDTVDKGIASASPRNDTVDKGIASASPRNDILQDFFKGLFI